MEGLTIDAAKIVIQSLPETFDSHNFIERFLLQYEDIYKSLFTQYDNDGVQKTHRLIGRFLVDNQEKLGIRKSEKVQSRNFHGNNTEVQCWTRIITNRKNNRVAQCVLFLLILLLSFQVLADGWRYGTKTQRTLALQNFDEQIKGWEWIIMDAAKFEKNHISL
jgi:hypothetical protein